MYPGMITGAHVHRQTLQGKGSIILLLQHILRRNSGRVNHHQHNHILILHHHITPMYDLSLPVARSNLADTTCRTRTTNIATLNPDQPNRAKRCKRIPIVCPLRIRLMDVIRRKLIQLGQLWPPDSVLQLPAMKIRCSDYDSSSDGRCQNCVRFNQQCLFHPVSSQAAFVPASALYGPNAVRAPIAGADGSQGQNWQHAPSTMLYGAHGQPLCPAGPGGQPQYSHPAPAQHPPSQTYPPGPYPRLPPPSYGSAPLPPVSTPGPQYDQQPQAPPTASSDRSDRGSLKRRPPGDDSHNESSRTAHFLHLTTKPCHSYEGRTSGGFEYANGPTSPATPTMSYQLYPPNNYSNGAQPVKGNNSPPTGRTPNSIHGMHSPQAVAMDSRTPPPAPSGSAGSSQNGRSGMKVHEMLGNPSRTPPCEPHDQQVSSSLSNE
ncbi:hypothetical protein H2198_009511 [Neophaeococcomyces mojaviensis]|uniref:Uncharacterized protein n=1 Tax=Neophaeococcomyces mojaviensis TaxID=3383035 RepID=A0ACC2ZU70_9EURO|nr:hypothetical protein H2198_009511 [Knufia sp. JES_112]